MGVLIRLLFLIPLVLIGSGCSSKTLVVLLPEEGVADGGNPGGITITTSAGTTSIDKAGSSVGFKRETQPGKTTTMSDQEIQTVFGDAIDSLPEAPVHFRLYFVSESTDLTAESGALLPDIFALMDQRNSTDISVVGHTDRAGDAAYNDALARKRAEYVAKMLVQRGISSEHIHITSHGENNPLIDTPDGVWESKNRRVEVVVR